MKYKLERRANAVGVSHPARGAWIEIQSPAESVSEITESHPARGAWIEITDVASW